MEFLPAYCCAVGSLAPCMKSRSISVWYCRNLFIPSVCFGNLFPWIPGAKHLCMRLDSCLGNSIGITPSLLCSGQYKTIHEYQLNRRLLLLGFFISSVLLQLQLVFLERSMTTTQPCHVSVECVLVLCSCSYLLYCVGVAIRQQIMISIDFCFPRDLC